MPRTDLVGHAADSFAWFAEDKPNKPFLILTHQMIEAMREVYGEAVDYIEQEKCEK